MPGSFVYTPASGTMLPVGARATLPTTFAPTDTTDYNTATGNVAITVVTAGRSDSTTYTLTENPVSEGGNWTNGKLTGLDWSNARTTPGLAFGTETGSGGYDDSVAILNGAWGPNQSAFATVHTVNQQSGSVYEEVELLLRWSISAHVAQGYEILFSARHNGSQYVQIVRWNGALGNFTYVSSGITGPGLNDGDTVMATIVGNVITGYINGVQVIQEPTTPTRAAVPAWASSSRAARRR